MLYANMIDEPEEVARFEDIYYGYRKQMLLAARQVLLNEQDAEDAVQAALLGIARRIKTIRTDEPNMLRAYVLLAAKNAAIDLKRRRDRLPEEADVEPQELPNPAQEDLFEWLTASMDYALLLNAMQKLESPYREVLFLCCVHQQSPSAAAEILHRKPGTVRQQLKRGRAMLVELCRKEGMCFGEETHSV